MIPEKVLPVAGETTGGGRKWGASVSTAYSPNYTPAPTIAQTRTLALPLWVPPELEAIPQWVCWRYDLRDGKPTKIPVNPHTGGNAKTDTPSTWGTLDAALDNYHAHPRQVSGIGLVVKNTAVVAVDLDDCLDSAGVLAPWARAIVRALDTYTEVSPSGRGLRLFAIGEKRGKREKAGDLEVYDKSSTRFLTFTGRHWDGAPLVVNSRTAEIGELYRATFPEPEPQPAQRTDPQPVPLEDADLLQRAFAARNGAAIHDLWHGNVTAYTSASEADLALVSHLLFWTGGDPERTDRLFRQSGLYRDKWDRRTGERTYGRLTIDTALAGLTTVYTPPAARQDTGRAVQAGGEVIDPKPVLSIADVWRVLNKAIHHDAEHCPICGTVRACERIAGDKVRGFLRTFRCHKAICWDWQYYRAKELVAQSGMHLWPAHYATILDAPAYDRLVNRGLLGDESDWLAVLELFDTVFLASAFPINSTSIGLPWDSLAPMIAERWLARKPGSRLRDPKRKARAKRAGGDALACATPQPEPTVTVPAPQPEPEPETRVDYAFGLAAMPMAAGFDLLDVLAEAGATVDRKRRRWEYPVSMRPVIREIVAGWASLTAKPAGHAEINAYKRTPTDAFISPAGPTVEALAGDLHPDIARMSRQAAARLARTHTKG